MSKRTTKSRNTARGASPKIRYEATGRNLTSQAGLIPVIKFLDGLGFNALFRCYVHYERGHNAHYQLVDAVFLVLIALMGGARNISQCVVLWSDGVVRRVGGWVRIPDESTVGRVFKGVGERHISELENLVHAARKRVWERALRTGTSRIALQCQAISNGTDTVRTPCLMEDSISSAGTRVGRLSGVAGAFGFSIPIPRFLLAAGQYATKAQGSSTYPGSPNASRFTSTPSPGRSPTIPIMPSSTKIGSPWVVLSDE